MMEPTEHVFSAQYQEKKTALLAALADIESREQARRGHPFRRIAAVAAAAAFLSLGIYAAVRVTFRAEQVPGGTRIEASGAENDAAPKRNWRTEAGEVSVKLSFATLPSDLIERENGKYVSNTPAQSDAAGDGMLRALTFAAADLRRGDYNAFLSGTAAASEVNIGGRKGYLISYGETAVYDRELWLLFEEEDLLLDCYVGNGITEEELIGIAEGISILPAHDEFEALPIYPERPENATEFDLSYLEDIGGAICLTAGDLYTDTAGNPFTVRVDGVTVCRGISGLDPADFIEGIPADIDSDGNFIPYLRTPVITGEDGVRYFGEGKTVTPHLVLLTLTVRNDGEVKGDLSCLALNLLFGEQENGSFKRRAGGFVCNATPGRVASDGRLIYAENSGEQEQPFVIPFVPGETVTLRLGYLVDEDCLGGMWYPVRHGDVEIDAMIRLNGAVG